MSLVKCKECKKEISNKADKCPHCGAPTKRKGTSIVTGLIVLILISWVASYFIEGPTNIRTSSTNTTKTKPKVYVDKKITTIKIVVPNGASARLCPQPNCDKEIARIPNGKKLTVEEVRNIKSGMLPAVKWFKVSYEGKKGWVSIFNTDKQ